MEIGIAPDDSFALVTDFDGEALIVINLSNYATSAVSLPGPPLGLSLHY